MTLKELGYEYLAQSKVIREKIALLKKESRGLTQKQLYNLRGRILSLYEDAAALRTVGEHLVNYYGAANE